MTELSASTVEFGNLRKNKHGGKVIYISGPNASKLRRQFPKMRAPFGLGSFTDKDKGTASYSIDLAFDDDPEVNQIRKILEEIDEMVVSHVAKNSKEFLGKVMSAQLIKDAMLYKPLVRPPSKEGFAHTFHIGLVREGEKFQAEVYNTKRKQIQFEEIEKNQKLVCIVDISSIYFINGKFGVSMRLQQCLAFPTEKLQPFAFVGIDEVDDSANEEEEEEEVDEGISDQESV